jgi:hypothetical protein
MTQVARFSIAALLAGVALIALGGCATDPTRGYTTNNQYVAGVRSVTVPIWTRGKQVYRRGMEMRLTEAIVKRVQQDTPYRITKKGRADTELRGTIDSISQRVLSYHPDTGWPRETEITLRVSFTWTDLRSGEVLAEGNLHQTGAYLPAQPMARFRRRPEQDFFQGSEDVVNKLAGRIVQYMEAEW